MQFIKYTIISILLLLLGCVTAPKTAQPFSELSIPKPANNEVVIVVFRKFTPPVLSTLTLSINNKTIELPNEAYTWVKLPAGKIKLSVEYQLIAMKSPTVIENEFLGASTHYFEMTYTIESATVIGSIVSLSTWQDLKEVNITDSINVLTECCRYISAD